MLVSPNNEMAAMLVSRSNPPGIESYYYANVFSNMVVDHVSETQEFTHNRAVYTKENKPRLTLAAAYIRREHPVKMVQNLRSRLSQAATYPGLGVLCTPRPEKAAAYFLSYKRP